MWNSFLKICPKQKKIRIGENCKVIKALLQKRHVRGRILGKYSEIQTATVEWDGSKVPMQIYQFIKLLLTVF